MPKGSGTGGGGGGGRSGGGGGGAGGGAVEKVPPAVRNPGYHSDSEDPVLNPGGVLTGPGKNVEHLPGADIQPITAYSGGHIMGGERFKGLNAEKLNRSIYDPKGFKQTLELSGESDAVIADYVKRAGAFKNELNASLDKVRNYEGQVYRTINDRSATLADAYVPGKPVVLKEFVSTSRSSTPSYRPFEGADEGQTRFVIKSKTGKWIEKVSNFSEENEVLFRSGTRFMVKSKKYNRTRGTWDIFMDEM
jgi:hypothetical protein